MKAVDAKKEPGHRLRVLIDEKTGAVRVEGNRTGLEYLSAVCRSVIGQPVGPNQWRLSEAFNTLDPQSLDLTVGYRVDLEP